MKLHSHHQMDKGYLLVNVTPFSPVDMLSCTLHACFHVGPEVGSVLVKRM